LYPGTSVPAVTTMNKPTVSQHEIFPVGGLVIVFWKPETQKPAGCGFR
jgi:hypothetical protein